MRRKALPPLVMMPLTIVLGCQPDLGAPASLITATRVLAIRGEPAEVAPGQAAAYTILVAAPEGTIAGPAVRWGYCTAPKPLTSDQIIAPDCLGDKAIQPLTGASGPIPADACSRFGPEVPPAPPGQPPARPRDPDVTGGYYQPVRAQVTGAGSAFALERVSCDLANASVDIVSAYRASYTANRNPTLLPPTATLAGQPVALDQIPAGAQVTFTTGWSADSAESFPVLDPVAQKLVQTRESLEVSWFATAGVFDADRTGRASDDPATTSTNGWRAPAKPGPVHLWLVLRDSRGGVDFIAADLAVK